MRSLLLLVGLLQVEPRDRCVLLSAEVRKSPPQIELHWVADPRAQNYSVSRKTPSETEWTELAPSVKGDETSFADPSARVGIVYEYKVFKLGQLKDDRTYQGVGHVMAGIEVPLRDRRGKVILIVDAAHAGPLAEPLERLRRDLVGDGWEVVRRDVEPKATPPEVKARIEELYRADRDGVKALFLFGHVAVPYSGDFNPDGHGDHKGAWPADAYYGDLDGEWSDDQVDDAKASRAENRNVRGDGKFDPSRIPSPVALEVGRVDLSQMPAFGKTEAELLRRYLDKDHDFRHRRVEAERRGLICDKFGDFRGEAFVSSGWRNFAPLVGDDKVTAADWFKTLGAGSYLVAQGSGAGGYQSCAGVGATRDFAATPTKAVFTLLFGSYFGDWDTRDNLLRAPLAAESHGLVAVWAGRPHWHLHPMALGETIGYCARLTQNNRGLYQPTGSFAGGVHVALMGDPTLRLHPVAPPSALQRGAGKLTWSASVDAGATYHVYHAADEKGPFTRLTDSPIQETAFAAKEQAGVYMVRAIKLETGPSGSYVNASQGIFAP
ncbi:MAG TPA: hypothetical protein VKW04_11845 [Planctomycetota bacterium]|nr:hypothetical protein [Planctomycetota bacterium]